MNREELGALHTAIATILAWPPAVFDQVVRWLAPEAATPNVTIVTRRDFKRLLPIRRTTGQARLQTKFNTQTAELRLFELCATPGYPYIGAGEGHFRPGRRPVNGCSSWPIAERSKRTLRWHAACGRSAGPYAAAGGGELTAAEPEADGVAPTLIANRSIRGQRPCAPGSAPLADTRSMRLGERPQMMRPVWSPQIPGHRVADHRPFAASCSR